MVFALKFTIYKMQEKGSTDLGSTDLSNLFGYRVAPGCAGIRIRWCRYPDMMAPHTADLMRAQNSTPEQGGAGLDGSSAGSLDGSSAGSSGWILKKVKA